MKRRSSAFRVHPAIGFLVAFGCSAEDRQVEVGDPDAGPGGSGGSAGNLGGTGGSVVAGAGGGGGTAGSGVTGGTAGAGGVAGTAGTGATGGTSDAGPTGGTGATGGSGASGGTSGTGGVSSSGGTGGGSAGSSCQGLTATCGPTNESCCESPLVPGGTFLRSYDGVQYTDQSYPATVSSFRLDKYEITVGRFRKFVAAYSPTMISAGAGKNPKGCRS